MFGSKPVWMKRRLSSGTREKLRSWLQNAAAEEKFAAMDQAPCEEIQEFILMHMPVKEQYAYLTVTESTWFTKWVLKECEKYFMRYSLPRGELSTQARSPVVRDYFGSDSRAGNGINADGDMEQIWYDYDIKQGY